MEWHRREADEGESWALGVGRVASGAPMSTTPVGVFLSSLRGGGTERVMTKLAASLAAEGERVDLVLAQAEGPYLNEVPPTVRIVDLATSRVLTSLPRLVRYLRRERPWALISAEGHTNVVALLARSLAGVATRVVVSERNVAPSHSVPMRARLFGGPLARHFYPRAHAVVAVSSGVADNVAAALRLPREQIEVIYNPVVTPELERKARESVCNPWFEAAAPPVVVAVGRLTPQKDFPTLIRAFRRLVAERPARLMILGEGPERPRLEALIDELRLTGSVELPGFIVNPYPYMRRADAFVLSSAWEGLPGVLIEAMACGCPVISTDCRSGPREILEDGRWGRLVPVGDATVLAQALREVLDAPPPVVPSAALARFTPANVTRQYRNVLQTRHGP